MRSQSALAVVAALLLAPAAPSIAQDSQENRRVVVRSGDTIFIEDEVDARIVRTRRGEVRMALTPDEREIVIMLDVAPRAGSVDGFVDRVWRVRPIEPFPEQLLWRGEASVEERSTIAKGDVRPAQLPVVVTPNARLVFAHPPLLHDEPGATVIAVSGAIFRPLPDSLPIDRSFDAVERAWVMHAEDVAGSTWLKLDTLTPGSSQTRAREWPGESGPAAAPSGAVRARDHAGDPALQVPQVIMEVRPLYTADAMRRGVSGRVELEVTVGTDGTVTDVSVVRPLDPDLDAAAIKAVREWRFVPGKHNGRIVPVVIDVDLTFSLAPSRRPPADQRWMEPRAMPQATVPPSSQALLTSIIAAERAPFLYFAAARA